MNAEESAIREMEQHVPKTILLTTLKDEEIEIPLRLSWSQELQVIALFQEVLKPEELGTILTGAKEINKLTESIEEDGEPAERDEDLNLATLASLDQFTALLGLAPKLTRFVEIIINRDEIWINDNFSLELIMKVIVPFVRRYKDMLTSLTRQVKPPVGAEAESEAPIQ